MVHTLWLRVSVRVGVKVRVRVKSQGQGLGLPYDITDVGVALSLGWLGCRPAYSDAG